MNELKHTPGPWKYDPNDRDDLLIKNEKSQLIAEVNDNRAFRLEQCQANAKLIAAAPDMFDAIKSALNIKDLWSADQHGTVSADHEGEIRALKAMQEKLESAYKKATE